MTYSIKSRSSQSNPGFARCPKCNEVIDGASTECRFCGSLLDPAELKAAATSFQKDTQARSRRNNRRALASGIFTLLFLGLFWGGRIAIQFVQRFVVPSTEEVSREADITELFAQDNYDAVIVAARKELSKRPNDPRLHLLLGKSFLLNSNPQAALVEFERVAKLKPGDAEVYLLIGSIYYDLKSFRQAESWLTKAVTWNPRDAKAIELRGVSHFMLAQNDLADVDFKTAAHLSPKTFAVVCGQGRAQNLKGEHAKALVSLEACVQRFPDNAVYGNLLAVEYLLDGRISDSDKQHRGVINRNPRDESVRSLFPELQSSREVLLRE